MATSFCSPLTFAGTCNNSFYFTASDTCLDEDGFKISQDCCAHFIRSYNNQFLLLSSDEDLQEFQIQDLTKTQQCQTDCKFHFQLYQNDPGSVSGPGKPVMLYVLKDGKKMVVCCSEEDVYPEEMDLPDKIEESSHKALFLLIQQSTSNRFIFQSSMARTKVLGLDPDKEHPSLNKLVLHHKAADEPDQRSEFSLL